MPQIKDARLMVLLTFVIAPAVAGVATALPSTPISAEITEVVHAIDANSNDGVDRSEWKEAGQLTFAAVDSDHDGQISRWEFTFLHGAMFTAIDADRDGRMTAQEIDAYKRLPWTLGIAH
jgi:Ca2+-binding EF-hand superfamily protein